MSHARFQKQQREKARQEKAAAKRDRRAARLEAAAQSSTDPLPSDRQAQVLSELDALHRMFAAGTIEFEEFELRKQSLIEQLVP